ncbi:hypothetical protein Tco_0321064 [Tanacetum coccineum]
MPKLRNTTTETGGYEQRPAPPGTLNVAQLRQTILLYQGKAEDHNGPMDVNQIAEKFRVDVAQGAAGESYSSLILAFYGLCGLWAGVIVAGVASQGASAAVSAGWRWAGAPAPLQR